MSFWAEDSELFLHKGQNGVVHVLRCKKETATSSSSSMLMKPEDFTDEGAVTDLRSLTGGCYDWDKNKYEALIDYIYPRHLLVNCHGSVIVELEPDEKSVLALLVNLLHINKKAVAVVYIRALDIIDMGSYGPGPDHPGQAVPVRTIKYLQDGTVVQTEPTPKEMKLSKEVETLRQELLSSKEKMEVEVAKKMKLTEELAIKSKKVETLEQELLLAKEKNEVELAKEKKLAEELAIKNKEVETAKQELLSAKEKTEVELAKEMKLAKELATKSKEVETLKQERERILKQNTVRIYTKAALYCSLTIRNGQAILGNKDDSDGCQYWVKDDKYGAIVKDKWGFPSYALVNKFTGQALKPNDDGVVELVHYNPNVLDKSILWTDQEQGDGYRAIRKATDPRLNLDAATQNGVGDGTTVLLWKWWGGDNQKWNIASYW